MLLYPNDLEKSRAYLKGKEIENNSSLVKRAQDLFNNDSFWLVAPHKLFEPGICRSIVTIDGKEALKVHYTIGGTTREILTFGCSMINTCLQAIKCMSPV